MAEFTKQSCNQRNDTIIVEDLTIINTFNMYGIDRVRRLLFLPVFVTYVVVAPLAAWAGDRSTAECIEEELLLPQATLVLKNAYLDKKGDFRGLFEFRNIHVSPALTVPGARLASGFQVSRPDAQIEFKDLNGTWTTLHVGPPEEYAAPADLLRVVPGSKANLHVVITPKTVVARSGDTFRLVLHFGGKQGCLVSTPFNTYPPRRPVRGFLSSPIGHGASSRNAGHKVPD